MLYYAKLMCTSTFKKIKVIVYKCTKKFRRNKMPALQIIATILAVALLIFAISKKLNATTTLFCIGFIILAVMSLINHTSVMGEDSIGSGFLDLFEYLAKQFASQTTKSGILIMSVMGFVFYMNHLKASNLLALLAAKPLKKLKSPYIAVGLAVFIGAVLKLFVPSHSGLTTLLMATIYPILIQIGVKKKTAVSTVVLSGAFDIGPACPVSTYVVKLDGIASETTISEFFVHQQLPVTVITILVVIAVFLVISIKEDKKDGSVAEAGETQDPKALGIPMFYALFPMIPLVLVLVFSKLVIGSIVMSVTAANILGFTIAFIINILCSKDKKAAFNDTQKFFDGMGNSFASVIALIIGAAVFTAGLNAIGGISYILGSLSSGGSGATVAMIVASGITLLTSLITGSGVAATYAIAPLMPPVAAATGISVLKLVEPVILSGGMGRAVAPVSAAVIIACRMSGVDIMDVVKRNIAPVLSGFVALIIASLVIL